MSNQVEKNYEMANPPVELGRGAFSIVVRAKNKTTQEEVAIKIINKKELGKEYEKNLKMEVSILKQVNHPNIIALKDMYDTPEKLYLVMELVTGGELFDKIVEKGAYTEQEASVLVHKIVSAILYLHDSGIAHRDLKPENLLLKSGVDDSDVAIADFGLSKIVGSTKMMQTACGTPSYVAPEVLRAQGYDKEVDMWSIGVITYILLCGFPPFYGDNVPEIFEQIMAANYDFPDEYWDDISPIAKDFIQKLLVVDPKKRATAGDCLAHPWISQTNTSAQPAKKLSKIKEELAETQKYRRAVSSLSPDF